MRPLATAANLTDQVAESIRASIGSGELRSGELYSVQQVADRLDVSRTPVREAVLGLADAGLVRVERNRGFRVLRRDPHQIAEVFALRILLEVPAARTADTTPALADALEVELAAMRTAADAHDEARFMAHDRAFHERLLAAAGNAELVRVVGGLRDAILGVRASTVDSSRSLHEVAEEHAPVLAAVRAGDRAAVGRTLAAHLARTAHLLVAQTVAENAVAADPRDIALVDSALTSALTSAT